VTTHSAFSDSIRRRGRRAEAGPAAVAARTASTGEEGGFPHARAFWSHRRPPESFSRAQLRQHAGVGARQNENEEVHVFLQDLPRVLDQHRTEEMTAGDFFGESPR